MALDESDAIPLAPREAELRLYLPTMYDEERAATVREAIEELPGIAFVECRGSVKQVTVLYYPDEISPEGITGAVARLGHVVLGQHPRADE